MGIHIILIPIESKFVLTLYCLAEKKLIPIHKSLVWWKFSKLCMHTKKRRDKYTTTQPWTYIVLVWLQPDMCNSYIEYLHRENNVLTFHKVLHKTDCVTLRHNIYFQTTVHSSITIIVPTHDYFTYVRLFATRHVLSCNG